MCCTAGLGALAALSDELLLGSAGPAAAAGPAEVCGRQQGALTLLLLSRGALARPSPCRREDYPLLRGVANRALLCHAAAPRQRSMQRCASKKPQPDWCGRRGRRDFRFCATWRHTYLAAAGLGCSHEKHQHRRPLQVCGLYSGPALPAVLLRHHAAAPRVAAA